jgi:hypothetical protein
MIRLLSKIAIRNIQSLFKNRYHHLKSTFEVSSSENLIIKNFDNKMQTQEF